MIQRPHILIFILGTALFSGGCAGVSKHTPVLGVNEKHLTELCSQHGIYWQWDPVSQSARLEYRGAVAEVLVGSSLVIIEGTRVTLSSPVRMERSAVIVPGDFGTKVLGRLRLAADKEARTHIALFRRIVIDAGHGGKDPGAIGLGGVYEKDIVLDISVRLKRILEDRGYSVTMTRDRDEFISLKERTQVASWSNADLFVSVHANSSPARHIQGIEVYTARHLGFHERAEDQRLTNQQLLFDRLTMANGSRDVENIVADMLYTKKQEHAKAFAEELAESTSRLAKTANRGEKESRFYVLRNTLIPAVLVEVGFLTNAREAKQLQTSTYRQRIAHGLAESIMEYANGQ